MVNLYPKADERMIMNGRRLLSINYAVLYKIKKSRGMSESEKYEIKIDPQKRKQMNSKVKLYEERVSKDKGDIRRFIEAAWGPVTASLDNILIHILQNTSSRWELTVERDVDWTKYVRSAYKAIRLGLIPKNGFGWLSNDLETVKEGLELFYDAFSQFSEDKNFQRNIN